MTPMRGWVAGLVGLGLAVAAAVSAQPAEVGALARTMFVGAGLFGCAWLWWVLSWWRPSVRTLMVWAVGLRLLFFPLLPSLSDDAYRYLWDGAIQIEGVSPYAHVPSDSVLEEYHDSVLFERMNSPSYYSVYPPVSQAAFRAAANVLPWGWQVAWYALKGLVLIAELIGVWILVRWAGPRAAAIYALHPVALVEVAGQAHTEGLLIGALGLAVWGLGRQSVVAAIGVSLSVWVKLWPVVWVPVVFRCIGWGGRAVSLAVLFGLSLSYELHRYAMNLADSLALYAGTFDFYSAPYRAVKSLVYIPLGDEAGQFTSGLMTLAWAIGCALAFVCTSATREGAKQVLIVATVGYVLTASTLHPWHWLAALWVLPLLQIRIWLYWIVSWSLLTYVAYVWDTALTLALVIGWGGGIALLLAGLREPLLRALMSGRARGKVALLKAPLSDLRRGSRLLDLGAGDGYVGRELADRTGCMIEAFDVVDYTATSGPPIQLFDGYSVPTKPEPFDATLLVYVLHHAEEPERLLREAVRITAGPVVVLETVCFGPRSKRWLERLDRVANRLRSGGHIDEAPLDIRTDAAWLDTFRREQIHLIQHRTWSGLHPRVLYVIEGQGATRSSTSSAEAVSASIQVASG